MYQVYCDDYLIYDTHIQNIELINPKVSLELNKVGSFSFTIYPSHPHFDDIQKLKSIITVYQDDEVLFRGRVLNDTQGFHNEKQVTCEGELAFLLDTVQRPYEFQGDINELFSNFINNHNEQVDSEHQFIVGEVTVTDSNNYINRSDTTYLTTWDSINQKLINTHGGYLQVRHEEDGNYIDYLVDFDVLGSQTIEFGKNLLDLSKTVKGEDVATAIIPVGSRDEETDRRITIESVNGGLDYVFNQEAVERYGWIFKTVQHDDVTLPSNLLRKGQEDLANAINLLISIELNAMDMASLDTSISAFKLGTYIKVKTLPHNLDTYMLVNKMSIDLAHPSNNTLTLGTSYETLTDKTSSTNKHVETSIKTVQDNQASVNASMQGIDEKISSAVSQMSDEISFQVNESHYLKSETNDLINEVETTFTQTKDEFEFRFNEFNVDLQSAIQGNDAKFVEINKYIRFIDGDIVLGEEGNQIILRIQNDRISFLENNNEVAYLSNNKLYVYDGEYINSLRIGNYAFMPRANGNISFKKVV